MKTCEEFAPLLSAYFDGELTEEERAKVRAHLSECEDCRVRLSEYAAVQESLLDAFAEEEPPADFASGVMAALRAEKASAAPKRMKKRTWRRFMPVAACAAIVLLTVTLFPQMSGFDAESADTAAPMMAQNVSESASGGTADSEEDAVGDAEPPETYYEYRDSSTYYTTPLGDTEGAKADMTQAAMKSAEDGDLIYSCEVREINGKEGLLWVHQHGPVVLDLYGAVATEYVEESSGVKDGDAGYYYLPVSALLALPEGIALSDVQAAELAEIPAEAEWVLVYPNDHSEVPQP